MYLIFIPSDGFKPGRFENLAAVDDVILIDETEPIVDVIFSSGRKEVYKGDQARIVIGECYAIRANKFQIKTVEVNEND